MPKLLIPGVLVAVFLLLLAAGCVGDQTQTSAQTVVTPAVTIAIPDSAATQQVFLSIPQAPLTDAEKQDITFLQEAEKLERDLYAKFARQYTSIPVFGSLAQAAGVYMNADNVILQRYNISNPDLTDEGKFSNQKLQVLYNTYASDGSTSSMAALKAAATSEDLHIADLDAAIGRTDNDDLKFIYRQERAFSRNNLRALVQWITAFAGTYSPTYLTKDSYNALISSPMEPVPLK